MNCIAIDDEPLALDIIKEFCLKIDFLNLVEICTNAFDAVKIINQQTIDLIFLDIQMPQITGLEFIKTLSNPPLIIFTTAYSEYALEGFDLNAVDYLLKPIPFERFFKAVNKAFEVFSLKKQNNKHPISKAEVASSEITDYFLVRVEYSTIKINFTDILYIEGLKDYVKILVKEKSYLTKSTMKNIEMKLPTESFIRIHKSYILSISKIEKIENNRVIIGEKRIPVGDHYKEEFNRKLNALRL